MIQDEHARGFDVLFGSNSQHTRLFAATERRGFDVFVRGVAVTKGSLVQRHVWRPAGRCILGVSEASGPKLGEWRALIATAAKRALGHEPPLRGPLQVDLTFYLPRPAAHNRAQRLVRWAFGNHRNDIDKLARAALDALTDSACWNDDSQVARLVAEKVHTAEGEWNGVRIVVEELR